MLTFQPITDKIYVCLLPLVTGATFGFNCCQQQKGTWVATCFVDSHGSSNSDRLGIFATLDEAQTACSEHLKKIVSNLS